MGKSRQARRKVFLIELCALLPVSVTLKKNVIVITVSPKMGGRVSTVCCRVLNGSRTISEAERYQKEREGRHP